MRSFKTEGIILKRTNFGEADRILTLYTFHFGKIKVLARGVRRLTSRKGGNLELFNWVRILASRQRNLETVTEVETVKSFSAWRKDLGKVVLAYYFCELVERLTAEGVPNQAIFDLLVRVLEKLGERQNYQIVVGEFERRILEETGFWPRGKPAGKIDLTAYIEKIIEGKLNSKKIFKDLHLESPPEATPVR